MKSFKAATLPLAAALVAFASTSQAQTNTNVFGTNLFPVTFRAVCTSTNSGGIFQEQVLNGNLIGDYAADNGVTNLSTLTLVYNRTNNSIQVVNSSNGAALFTSFSFTGGTTFTNTNGTLVVFQQNVMFGTNTTNSGVIFGSATYGTNLATSYGLRAELFYIEPAVGTNAASLCRAVLRVGSAIHEENEENEDHHGPPSRPGGPPFGPPPGNHYGWDNPHNPHSRR